MNRRTFCTMLLSGAAGACLPYPAAWRTFAAESNVREFRMTPSVSKVNLGAGPDFQAWTYNGQVPGPEIRVREGETIRVVLKNDLPEPTTIHWHGIPVPNGMDGVPHITQEPVMPGQTFVYEFEARPAGTFLYHSHVSYQLDRGLYGPLIIEPADSSSRYDRSYTLVLEDWVMTDGGGPAARRRRPPGGMGMMGGMGRRGMMGRRDFSGDPGPVLTEPVYDAYTINGRLYPQSQPLTVTRGDLVHLRLINASSSTIYYLRLAGHPFTVTALDGMKIAPRQTDTIRIGMGERYDVEFRADNPGHWLLSAYETGAGEGMLGISFRYTGINQTAPVPPRFGPETGLLRYWDCESLNPAAETGLPPTDRHYLEVLSGGMHSPYWTINGQVYPDVEPLPVRRGEYVRMRYVNRSMMPHPMHLHGHFFRIVNPGLDPGRWIFKDTVIVDPMQAIEVEFLADNPGRWFHHCHNLYHMEAGMANVVSYAY